MPVELQNDEDSGIQRWKDVHPHPIQRQHSAAD